MSVLAPGRNLVLIGLMGSGKTSVGRALAAQLERPFVDTDEVVARESGMSVPELFRTHGERGFREEEAAAIRHVSALRGQVVAVGGGAVLDPHNVTTLRSTGDLVLLTAPAEVLASRLEGTATDERPLLDGAPNLAERLALLAEERAEAYESAATSTVSTAGRTVEEIAEEVLEWARQRPGLLAREEQDG